MTSLPPSVQSVLELFQGPLASVRFAGIDAAGLAQLAAEVEAASTDVREHESKLGELRQILAQRQEALLALAQQALAYARVYAENDEALLEAVNRISLPRAAKPRKSSSSSAPASAKGTGARDGGSEAAAGTEADAAGLDLAGAEADAPSGESTAEAASSDADAGASPLPAPPARSSRKGRAAASTRAAN